MKLAFLFRDGFRGIFSGPFLSVLLSPFGFPWTGLRARAHTLVGDEGGGSRAGHRAPHWAAVNNAVHGEAGGVRGGGAEVEPTHPQVLRAVAEQVELHGAVGNDRARGVQAGEYEQVGHPRTVCAAKGRPEHKCIPLAIQADIS